jgi:hypothetical protein
MSLLSIINNIKRKCSIIVAAKPTLKCVNQNNFCRILQCIDSRPLKEIFNRPIFTFVTGNPLTNRKRGEKGSSFLSDC